MRPARIFLIIQLSNSRINFDVTVDGNILIQNIFCIQHTTIDLKIKDMVKYNII